MMGLHPTASRAVAGLAVAILLIRCGCSDPALPDAKPAAPPQSSTVKRTGSSEVERPPQPPAEVERPPQPPVEPAGAREPSPKDARLIYGQAFLLLRDFPYPARRDEMRRAAALGYEHLKPDLIAYVEKDHGVTALAEQAKDSLVWDVVRGRKLTHELDVRELLASRAVALYLLLKGKWHEAHGRRERALDCFLAARRVGHHIVVDPLGICAIVAIATEIDSVRAMSNVVDYPRPLRDRAIRECVALDEARTTLADLVRREGEAVRNTVPKLARHLAGKATVADTVDPNFPHQLRSLMEMRGLEDDAPWIVSGQRRIDAYLAKIAPLAAPQTLREFVKKAEEPSDYLAQHKEVYRNLFRDMFKCSKQHRTAIGERRRELEAELDEHLGKLLCIMSHCLLVPSYDGFARETARSEAERTGLVIRLALANYREDHGHYPDRLSDLVPGYLSKLRVDPFDGEPFRYRKLAEGYQLYSVGVDFDDDHGRPPSNPGELSVIEWVLRRTALDSAQLAEEDARTRERLKAEIDQGRNPSEYDGVDGDILLGWPPSDE